MKTTTWLVIGVLLFSLASCGKSKEKRIQEIADYEKSLSLETAEIANKGVGDSLIAFYTAFAKDFAKDSLAPFYLFKAADVAMNINNSEESIMLLDKIIAEYPHFIDLPTVYFFKGYVYENCAFELDKAVEAYQLFIDTYPNHHLVNDAKVLIENINLSPEELIEKLMLQQKEEKDSLSV